VQTQLSKSITEAIAFTRQQKALEIEQQVLQDNSDSQGGIGLYSHKT